MEKKKPTGFLLGIRDFDYHAEQSVYIAVPRELRRKRNVYIYAMRRDKP